MILAGVPGTGYCSWLPAWFPHVICAVTHCVACVTPVPGARISQLASFWGTRSLLNTAVKGGGRRQGNSGQAQGYRKTCRDLQFVCPHAILSKWGGETRLHDPLPRLEMLRLPEHVLLLGDNDVFDIKVDASGIVLAGHLSARFRSESGSMGPDKLLGSLGKSASRLTRHNNFMVKDVFISSFETVMASFETETRNKNVHTLPPFHELHTGSPISSYSTMTASITSTAHLSV